MLFKLESQTYIFKSYLSMPLVNYEWDWDFIRPTEY